MRNVKIETDPNAIAYGMDLMEDLAKVRAGMKPLLIADESKCVTAFAALEDIVAADPALYVRYENLDNEDGEETRHAFVCAAGAPYADEAWELVLQSVMHICLAESPHAATVMRENLQMKLGMMLGYSAAECLEFIASETGRTCKCDCCGSQYSAEEPTPVADTSDDPNPGRFVDNSFRY